MHYVYYRLLIDRFVVKKVPPLSNMNSAASAGNLIGQI